MAEPVMHMHDHFIPQELYDLILHHVPIPCVDVAIRCSAGVLLVKRRDPPAQGQWWLPGGRVWKGETLQQAARRKALEEVGLECHVGPVIHTAETIFSDGPRGIPVHSVNACLLLSPVQPFSPLDIQLDSHHDDWQWVQVVPSGLTAYMVECLRKAGLDEVFGRGPCAHC